MSGVVPEALSFAFECVSPGTRFAGAKLEIENVPLVVRCESCDAESRLDEPFFFCPKCGGFSLTVVSGDEMNVASVDVDDGEVL
jgi:hydrogenase nickel incorporation protein HypA/HybF